MFRILTFILRAMKVIGVFLTGKAELYFETISLATVCKTDKREKIKIKIGAKRLFYSSNER